MMQRQVPGLGGPQDALSRGKRKLDGKSFYLDSLKSRSAALLAEAISQLGGRVESFLHKDVSFVVTGSQECLNKQSSVPTRAESGGTSGEAPRPTKQRENVLPNSHGQQPGTPRPTGCSSRGKALLEKAIRNNERLQGSSVLENARSWGVKILHVDDFLSYLQRLSTESSFAKRRRPEQKNATKCTAARVVKAAALRSPYLKIEDSSRKYMPLHMQSMTFPTLCYLGRFSPFEPPPPPRLSAITEVQNRARERSRDASSSRDRPQTPFGRTPSPGRAHKKNLGYCECCHEPFKNQEEHIQSEQHRHFVLDSSNYSVVDQLVADMQPGFDPNPPQQSQAVLTRLPTPPPIQDHSPPELEPLTDAETEHAIQVLLTHGSSFNIQVYSPDNLPPDDLPPTPNPSMPIADGQPLSPNTDNQLPIGQPLSLNTENQLPVGQPLSPNTDNQLPVGQPLSLNTENQLPVGQPLSPNTDDQLPVGQPLSPNTDNQLPVGQPLSPNTDNQLPVGQPLSPNTDNQLPVGQPLSPNTDDQLPVGQPLSPNTDDQLPVSQPLSPNTDDQLPVGQPLSPNTDDQLPVGQPLSPNTDDQLPVSQPLSPNTDDQLPVGQPLSPNTDKLLPVGQPLSPNTDDQLPVGQPLSPSPAMPQQDTLPLTPCPAIQPPDMESLSPCPDPFSQPPVLSPQVLDDYYIFQPHSPYSEPPVLSPQVLLQPPTSPHQLSEEEDMEALSLETQAIEVASQSVPAGLFHLSTPLLPLIGMDHAGGVKGSNQEGQTLGFTGLAYANNIGECAGLSRSQSLPRLSRTTRNPRKRCRSASPEHHKNKRRRTLLTRFQSADPIFGYNACWTGHGDKSFSQTENEIVPMAEACLLPNKHTYQIPVCGITDHILTVEQVRVNKSLQQDLGFGHTLVSKSALEPLQNSSAFSAEELGTQHQTLIPFLVPSARNSPYLPKQTIDHISGLWSTSVSIDADQSTYPVARYTRTFHPPLFCPRDETRCPPSSQDSHPFLPQAVSSVCIESALVPDMAALSPSSSDSDWDCELLSRLGPVPAAPLRSTGRSCGLDLDLLQRPCTWMHSTSYESHLHSVLQPAPPGSSLCGEEMDPSAFARRTVMQSVVQSVEVQH